MASIIAPRRGSRILDFTKSLRSLTTLDKACYSTAKLLFVADNGVNGASFGIEAFGGMHVVERIAGVNTVVCSTAGYTSWTTSIWGIGSFVVDIGAAYDAAAFSGSTIINYWRTGSPGETPSTQGLGGGNGVWYDGSTYGGSFSDSYGFNAYPRPACGSKPTNYLQLTVSDRFAYTIVAKP